MNVLIAGATSIIGQAVAERFARGNSLFLLARDSERCKDLSRKLAKTAASVSVLEFDLSESPLSAIPDDLDIDLFVNLASTTSRLRDSSISINDLASQAKADLITPVELVQKLSKQRSNKNNPLDVIFVSTVLTSVISPNRRIYSAYKVLQEEYLKILCSQTSDSKASVKLMTVLVSTFISPEKPSSRALQLADKIYNAYEADESRVSFGLSGRLLKAAFYIQPTIYLGLVRSLRLLRSFLKDPIK